MTHASSQRKFTHTLALTILSFVFAQSAFAQTDTGTVTSVNPSIVSSSTTTTTSTVIPSGSSVTALQGSTSLTVQATFNNQTAASSSVLESTTDPQTATSSASDPAQIPLTTATSTDPGITLEVLTPNASASSTVTLIVPSSIDVVASVMDPVTDASSSIQISAPVQTPIPITALKPQQAYTFALSGETIPTTQSTHNSDGTVTQSAASSQSLTPVINNDTGTVTLAGSCSLKFFVILLYRNASDYTESPSSYIINRAYPCIGGQFIYSISQLPHNLPSGGYYVMVGQEGGTGSWTPITGLTPITITKQH